MPVEHGPVGERRREVAVEVHHHLGDAALGGLHAGRFRAKTELLAQRGLHAVAVEDFSLDLGGLHGLVADQLDPEGFLIVRPDMLAGADELAGLEQELLLQRLQHTWIIGEFGPFGLLPVPRHEL